MIALTALAWTGASHLLEDRWNQFSPYDNSGTAFLACMLGALSWWPLNLVLPFQVSKARLYRDLQINSLERLLYRAATDTAVIQVTMTDGKIYVGFVAAVPPDPSAPDAYLQLLPTMSGYRDSDTKQVVFTTFYDEIYAGGDIDPEDFVKVPPLANVESAGPFRADVYLRFLKARSASAAPSAEASVRRFAQGTESG